MSYAKMAWRNLWRNRRRTFITVAATSLALLVMIAYSGLVTGYVQVMERNLLDVELGDVQVFAAGYRDKPSLYDHIERSDELLAALDREGYPAAGRLLATGLGAAGDSSAGVMLRGVEIERDARVSRVGERLSAGQWLSAADPKGVVIGKRLARTLGVKPGGELVVLGQAADGSTANDVYLVRGVLETVGAAADATAVFMLAATFRELMVFPTGVHQLIVRRPADVPLPVAAARVRELTPGLDTKTWRELMPTLASMLDSARGAMNAMFFIVYLAIGILILNAMLMAVFERIRELGILKALGFGPLGVVWLIFLESAMQVGVAVVVGASLATPLLYYLSHTGLDTGRLGGVAVSGAAIERVWRASVSAQTYLAPIATLVIIVFVAIIYPALKAAAIRPVEAIHHR